MTADPTLPLTQSLDVDISSGASLSGAVNAGNRIPIGIHMPATWTAANLTFQVSDDGTTWRDLYDDAGNEITVTAAASRGIAILEPNKILPFRYFKIRSGTSGTPVNQGADRTLVVEFARPVSR